MDLDVSWNFFVVCEMCSVCSWVIVRSFCFLIPQIIKNASKEKLYKIFCDRDLCCVYMYFLYIFHRNISDTNSDLKSWSYSGLP